MEIRKYFLKIKKKKMKYKIVKPVKAGDQYLDQNGQITDHPIIFDSFEIAHQSFSKNGDPDFIILQYQKSRAFYPDGRIFEVDENEDAFVLMLRLQTLQTFGIRIESFDPETGQILEIFNT